MKKNFCPPILLSKKTVSLLFCLLVFFCLSAQNPYKRYTENLPFAMSEVKAPVIPDTKVFITEFGGDATGQTLCTEAFAKAIDVLAGKGGGHLIVPAGVWFTGPIQLKSNIDLHLEMGAVIKFAADESLYPVICTSFEGLDTRRCQSPLSANGCTNISITGQGAIDGNGEYWRPVKKSKVTDAHWKRMLAIPGSIELKKATGFRQRAMPRVRRVLI